MEERIIKAGKLKIRVITPENQSSDDITPEDQEMDKRVVAAVKSAINKAKVCNKPIAKYDTRKKNAYLKMADGEKRYID